MDESATPIRSKHLPIVASLFLILAFAWLFYLSDVLVVDYLKAKWPAWFGREWWKRELEWQFVTVRFLVSFVPMIVFLALAAVLFNRFNRTNFASTHEGNLRELSKAKVALQQSLTSIASIEQEYRGKLQSFEQLQNKLAELQAVKNIDTEDLRKKLNAIAAVNRHAIWFERGLAFFIGVLASLMATFIWERLR